MDLFYKRLDYCRKVLASEIVDYGIMPWIFELNEDDDLEDEKNWVKANPAMPYGVIDVQRFKEDWERDKSDIATRMNFIRKNYNRWTNSRTQWMSLEAYSKCEVDSLPQFNKNTAVYIGLDAGSLQDLTAITVIFCGDDNKYYIETVAFTTKKALEKRKAVNLLPYDNFAGAGELTIAPGDVIEIEKDIYPILNRYIKDFNVRSIVVDDKQLLQLSAHYLSRGVSVQRFYQNAANFGDPIAQFERCIHTQDIVIKKSALLRWQMGHAEIKSSDRGRAIITTPSDHQKDDNIVATLMAFSQAMLHKDQLPMTEPKVFWV